MCEYFKYTVANLMGVKAGARKALGGGRVRHSLSYGDMAGEGTMRRDFARGDEG